MNQVPLYQDLFARLLSNRKIQVLGILSFFIGILFFAFFLRIQGVHSIPYGQFTGTDAYFYYWQAQLVSENGHLPSRDMHRWLPIGRDLGQTLNLYGYVLAYTHKILAALFPNLSLYHITFYAPVVCFCLGVFGLFLFLYRTQGVLFSIGVGVLLAVLPGTLERSAAGFSDRDAWCFLVGTLAVTTYLVSLESQNQEKKILWTLASGGAVFLGGISWEGFGVFLSVILVVEIWRFLSSETEDGLRDYILWVCLFVPTLYLASPAYRSGYGFAKHLFVFMLVPPVVLLGLRCLRYLLLSNIEKLRRHARLLALGLTVACIAIALVYVSRQHYALVETTVLFSENTLMKTVGELKAPRLQYWIFRYGSVFILGSIGFIIAINRIGCRIFMLTPFILFIITTFFREPLEKYLWNVSHNTLLFFLVMVFCVIMFLIAAVSEKYCEPHASINIAFTAWFFLWGSLARDARRYDLFFSVSLTFFSMETVRYITHSLAEGIWHSKYTSALFRKEVPTSLLRNGLTFVMIGFILFWPITAGHTLRAYKNVLPLRSALPGNLPVTKALEWIQAELPATSVVAARWRYGSMLNVLGGVKTIIDQDHYIPYWIHLYQEHVKDGTHPRSALVFLKTHDATHLMVTQKYPPLIVRNALSGTFIPVYPTEKFENSMVKIWAIYYPPNIEPDPKYLKTGIREIDTQLQLQ